MYKYFEEWNIYVTNCQNNLTRSDSERRECLKYHIYLQHYKALISLPPEMDHGSFPNVGPKVNHHFKFNNTVFGEIEHPRWGTIMGIWTKRPIKAGEEILAHYHYKEQKEFPKDFPWYFEAQAKYLKEQQIEEQCYLTGCDE